MRKSLKALAVFAGAAALVVSGTAVATASGDITATCSGGLITTRTYHHGLRITGKCKVNAGSQVVVNGNLVVMAGATFDAQTASRVTVNGDVVAGPGSLFGLGCTYAHPCDNGNPPWGGTTHDVVTGTVHLNQVFDAAINGSTIGGSIVSFGGGAGLLDPEEQFVPFSIKDDVVGGSISITGLTTVWFGIIRTHIGRSVTLTDINLSDPDGNEIVTNVISGNLSCTGLDPAPQVGDSEGAANVVGKVASGQCADLAGGGAAKAA